MPKNYDSCVNKIRKKIKQGKIPKTYHCDKYGKKDKKGKKRCKSNEYALCSNLLVKK